MTGKELKRMSRSELLQMLLTQVEENERLKKQLDDANKKLQDRRIACENVGSIAEAALKLNGVFEAAQQAAQQYLETIYYLDVDRDTLIRKMEAEARQKADAIMTEADEYRTRVVKETEDYRTRIVTEANEYWEKIQNMVGILSKEL